jgi:5'-methylthioadenosine phosphorylase
MAHVTDFDVWHETEEEVTVEALIETLNANVEIAREAVRGAVKSLAAEPELESHQALASALISARKRSAVPPETWDKLELLVGRYFE